MHKGFADLSLTTWVRRQTLRAQATTAWALRAGHGIRTRDFDLGKVALYH